MDTGTAADTSAGDTADTGTSGDSGADVPAGECLLQATIEDRNGEVYWTETVRYIDGLIVEHSVFQPDAEVSDYTYFYTYDDDGRLETRLQESPNLSTLETYTYNVDDSVARVDFDKHIDGTTDQIYVFTYATDGDVETVTEEHDYDNDGVYDRLEVVEDDTAARSKVHWEDHDYDGVIDQQTWSTYLENGDDLHVENDNTGNGVVDYEVAYSYLYDGDGRRLERAGDEGNDGSIDTRDVYERLASGHISTVTLYSGGDDASRVVLTLHYDWSACDLSSVEP